MFVVSSRACLLGHRDPPLRTNDTDSSGPSGSGSRPARVNGGLGRSLEAGFWCLLGFGIQHAMDCCDEQPPDVIVGEPLVSSCDEDPVLSSLQGEVGVEVV